jgi:3-hydroxybutyryl-CoA dehydratase
VSVIAGGNGMNMTASVWQDPQSKTFEDFSVGDVLETRGRTIEAADLHAFAGLTGDHYPLHVDAVYAEATRFASRIAQGALVFSIAIGLVVLTGYLGDAVVALAEVERIRALKPVLPGDTIWVRAEVTATEPASKPHIGVLRIAYSVRNQTDAEVMTFSQSVLARRHAPTATGE